MDKQLAFYLIVAFVIIACFVTYSAISGPKRNKVCKFIAYGYTVFMWLCIVALSIITIAY